MNTKDLRIQALNLALMHHRQNNVWLSDDQIIATAEKFADFVNSTTNI